MLTKGSFSTSIAARLVALSKRYCDVTNHKGSWYPTNFCHCLEYADGFIDIGFIWPGEVGWADSSAPDYG